MSTDDRINLIAKIARSPQTPREATENVENVTKRSILTLAAASYGSRPLDESTIPTGFDPFAAALFESIVEGAYLVATADGIFDDEERRAFERIVTVASGGTVSHKHVAALISELADQIAEEGVERRIHRLAEWIQRREQALEILRIAALVAQVSEDVSPVEREMLDKIARACRLDEDAVESAIEDVRASLGVVR